MTPLEHENAAGEAEPLQVFQRSFSGSAWRATEVGKFHPLSPECGAGDNVPNWAEVSGC